MQLRWGRYRSSVDVLRTTDYVTAERASLCEPILCSATREHSQFAPILCFAVRKHGGKGFRFAGGGLSAGFRLAFRGRGCIVQANVFAIIRFP